MLPVTDVGANGRGTRLWAMVAENAADRGRPADVMDACSVAVKVTGAGGAGVTMTTHMDSGRVVYVTDGIGARVEELQLTYGEGPGADARATRAPVLSSDLRSRESLRRWPVFAPAAAEIGAAAIFAFPLQMGAVLLGVMDLYRAEPRSLGAGELRDALLLADTATLLLIGREPPPGDPATEGSAHRAGGPEGYRAEIDQATGMISAQLSVGIDEAFVRLRGRAYADERRLTDVARDVVARRLRFTTDGQE